MKHWIPVLTLAFVTLGADAAPVYRCGGGTYSQTPCPGGAMVEATDPRSAAQRAEARRLAAAEKRRAREMERDRMAQEQRSAKEPAIASLGPERAAKAPAQAASKPSSKSKRKAKSQNEDFRAVAPKAAQP
ncbi:hypothetical protein FSC37_16785 [Piscinibacter aquaticus]|uniref:DUF4124 domain-containing protein n=1 Tax=Piscinibacter aquaticus TaxID=392597 RepID=A0A5C6U1J7_9BURK|nr:hypothetical protein FSC37_16785 [Piscinibacter aquaticus]